VQKKEMLILFTNGAKNLYSHSHRSGGIAQSEHIPQDTQAHKHSKWRKSGGEMKTSTKEIFG
jgi:hypothetical protein